MSDGIDKAPRPEIVAAVAEIVEGEYEKLGTPGLSPRAHVIEARCATEIGEPVAWCEIQEGWLQAWRAREARGQVA